MYLLNRDALGMATGAIRFTFHYVSIKSMLGSDGMPTVSVFTFHYVSIKSTSFI